MIRTNRFARIALRIVRATKDFFITLTKEPRKSLEKKEKNNKKQGFLAGEKPRNSNKETRKGRTGVLLAQRKTKGGGKLRGGENIPENPFPKKVLDPPTYDTFPPPPLLG